MQHEGQCSRGGGGGGGGGGGVVCQIQESVIDYQIIFAIVSRPLLPLCPFLAPSPLVTSPVTMAVTQPVIPEWKRALQEKKHKELAVRDGN